MVEAPFFGKTRFSSPKASVKRSLPWASKPAPVESSPGGNSMSKASRSSARMVREVEHAAVGAWSLVKWGLDWGG